MTKSKTITVPTWVYNLRMLMERKGFNPRSLSLKAGLNATAVRDMLEGRSRFPRYDTAQALANALETTPAHLMSDDKTQGAVVSKGQAFVQDVELLTEIITRLEEVTGEVGRKLPPRDFASMATTVYQRLSDGNAPKKKMSSMRLRIHDLLDHEMVRQKRRHY